MHAVIGLGITACLRWIFAVLAAYILLACIFSLLSTRCTPEVWGNFVVENEEKSAITHWENVIGRAKSTDLKIQSEAVSKNHALLIRKDNDKWILKDLDSKNGTHVNGKLVHTAEVGFEDELLIGDKYAYIIGTTPDEEEENKHNRRFDRKPISPWRILIAITVFQILTVIQLLLGMGKDATALSLISILLLSVIMWGYVMFFSSRGARGFEMEMIAFFMSTINLAVTASFDPSIVYIELIAVALGVLLMVFMCHFLRDLEKSRRIRPILIGLSVIALIINLIFGTAKNGAVNWVEIGGHSIQPSELVKLAFVFVGAGALDELYDRKNTVVFAFFSLFCLGCLAMMSDFGTALIFFTAYLVISFLRSGDFSRMILSATGVGALGLMILEFKPYIASRFVAWGHVWEPEFMNDIGYQQTRTMSFGAGGGLLGLGAGNGSLKNLDASNTDLVFGFIMEEWGLIIAVLLILCIVTLSLFAVMSIMAGRSTFYTILSCGAATFILIQTMLNVFGSIDMFPLTGVTFPFVSTGGTSMLTSWGMLAYLKASDMRQNASIAVRRK